MYIWMLGETSEIRAQLSCFHALPNQTLCCSSGLDRKPNKSNSIFLVFYPLIISFDSLFGFVLVVRENISTYTHVISICSFSTSSNPSKYVLIVINSDFAICRGKNMKIHTLSKSAHSVPECKIM